MSQKWLSRIPHGSPIETFGRCFKSEYDCAIRSCTYARVGFRPYAHLNKFYSNPHTSSTVLHRQSSKAMRLPKGVHRRYVAAFFFCALPCTMVLATIPGNPLPTSKSSHEGLPRLACVLPQRLDDVTETNDEVRKCLSLSRVEKGADSRKPNNVG